MKKFRIKDLSSFPSVTGVYIISFDGTKKVYVGSASSKLSKIKSGSGFYGRWKKHIHLLKNKNHHSPALQNAFNKYGEDKMFFSIVEICDSEECIKKEQYYIDFYNSFNCGYNGRPNASSNLGYKQSDEQKNKIRNKYKEIRDVIAKDVIKLYNENKTTREIADELNISRNYIKRIFKENNIQGKNTAFYKKKKLFQYDLCGNLIKEWDSIRGCADELGIKPVSIRFVLKGVCKHSNGFYFNLNRLNKDEALNFINVEYQPKTKKYKNIKQVDVNGNCLKIWTDIKEIVNTLCYPGNGPITQAVKNNKKYKGFYWVLE